MCLGASSYSNPKLCAFYPRWKLYETCDQAFAAATPGEHARMYIGEEPIEVSVSITFSRRFWAIKPVPQTPIQFFLLKQ